VPTIAVLAEEMSARIARPSRWTSAGAACRCQLCSEACLPFYFPSYARSLPRGFAAPCGTRSSASHCAPLWGLGSSQNKLATFSKERSLQTALGSLPESRSSALGSRAHSRASLNVTRATTGEFKKRRHSHVSEQSNADRFSRQQRRGSQQQRPHRSLTSDQVLLQKERRYTLHTEWHRCVVFGKLSEFAKTLTKGAHIQVEGELRSREYDSKKTESRERAWEIRVSSILTLDRTEFGSPVDDWASIAVRFSV
jgi:single-strand DNA-binding protein